MSKNDRMPTDAISATSNTKKCASVIKTVLGSRREKSLPSMRKNQDFDAQNLPKNETGSNAIEIKSGIAVRRVYNVENAEVVNPNFMKKGKETIPKVFDKKRHIPPAKTQNREQLKKLQRRSKEKHNIAQIKNKGKLQRSTDVTFNGRKCSHEKTKSSLILKRSLEPRFSTKVWQILNPNSGDLIQATDSVTKRYIISVIKKYNRKGKNKIPAKETQTSKETISSNHDNRTTSIKHALRRPLWQLAKASIKHSEHWSKFLAANNIVLENINIDKFDLSLIDVDALGIENKLLKRTIMWLFK